MDKASIFRAFDFVGYHVCKHLLNKGVEVEGIHNESAEDAKLINEKRLEIGRNANFKELSLNDWGTTPSDSETIIISIYDVYMLHKEIEREAEMKSLHSYLTGNKENIRNLVLLVPVQLLNKTMEQHSLAVLNELVKAVNGLNKETKIVYLPTIYGPWQPDTFIFQHSILNDINKKEKSKGFREDTTDALYVEDTVTAIMKVIEHEPPGIYLLESGEPNKWEMCAAHLQVDEKYPKGLESRDISETITRLKVTESIPMTTALTKQIELTNRIYKP